jgi:hypothetical protein
MRGTALAAAMMGVRSTVRRHARNAEAPTPARNVFTVQVMRWPSCTSAGAISCAKTRRPWQGSEEPHLQVPQKACEALHLDLGRVRRGQCAARLVSLELSGLSEAERRKFDLDFGCLGTYNVGSQFLPV